MVAAEKAEPIDSAEAKEPIDPAEQADPTDPIESTDPIDPIEKAESLLQIEKTEFVDPIDVLTCPRLPPRGTNRWLRAPAAGERGSGPLAHALSG
jgi:hypothetical protein